MLRTTLLSATMVAAFALSGCGTSPGDRAITGAGLGAAAGAVIGGVTGGSVGTGAVVGAVAGGVVGAVTTKDDIDIGDPPWKKSCKERQRRGDRVDCSREPRR